MKVIVLSREVAMAATPYELYQTLKAAGLKLNPFRSGGTFQPLSDWLEYEGRFQSLLVAPW